MSNNSGRGMFASIVEKANKTANSELAKKIRKNLIKWGIVGAVLSGIMFLGGLIGFMTSAVGRVGGSSLEMSREMPVGIIISIVFFMLGAFGGSISALAIKSGLSIVIAGIATNVLDVNKYCPNCKDKVEPDELYCNKCGANLRANKLCSCGTQNDLNDKFCKKCGKDLNSK